MIYFFLIHNWEDKGVHTFPKGICLKVNIIARLEFELAYYDSAVHRFNHYTTRTPHTPNQAETLLHSLERAAAGIGLHVNANKTEYMCYNQTGNIATLDGASLKLVDKFTYLGSSVSSTEKDIDHTTDEGMDSYR